MDTTSIESILNGGSETVETQEVAAEVSQETAEATTAEAEAPADEAAGRPRDDKGRFATKGEQPSADAPEDSAPPALTEEAPVDVPAIIAERRKRQAAEARLHELEAQFAEIAAPAVHTSAMNEAPDPIDDPVSYREWVVQEARSAAIAAHQEERIVASADAAREKYPDYTEAVSVFAQMARQNPALERSLRTAKNPGEYAYSQGKLYLDLHQHGSLEALIAARAQEEAAKLVANANTPKSDTSSDVQLPESLAGTQSARGSSAAMPVRRSLDDILNGPRK